MSKINWKEVLGWKEDELDDLRFVGYSYIRQGCYDIALTFFEALVLIGEDKPYDLQTLGAIYLQKGNHLMALSYLERALKRPVDFNAATRAIDGPQRILETFGISGSLPDFNVGHQAK